MMSSCACEHDGVKVISACGLHFQYARDYAKELIEELRVERANLKWTIRTMEHNRRLHDSSATRQKG